LFRILPDGSKGEPLSIFADGAFVKQFMSVTIAPNIHHDPPRPPRAVLPTIRRSLARRELPLLPGLVDLDPGREQVVRAGLEGAVDGVSGEVDAGPLPVLADVGYHQCAGNGVVIDHGSVVAGQTEWSTDSAKS